MRTSQQQVPAQEAKFVGDDGFVFGSAIVVEVVNSRV
jgi:hypothetical protein